MKTNINIIESVKNLTTFEKILWVTSIIGVAVSSIIAKGNPLSIVASLIGVAALIFVARGDVIGQIMMIAFSVLYAIISYRFAYYGEMITYVGMSLPMNVFSVVSWIRNPHSEREVKVNHIGKKETILMFVAAVVVTAAFYFILKFMGTSNLIPSTISVITTFVAAYLTFRRSKFYAVGYACNDVVLIVLWLLAAIENATYVPMIICFVIFLVNDVYGFVSWNKMSKRQNTNKNT